MLHFNLYAFFPLIKDAVPNVEPYCEPHTESFGEPYCEPHAESVGEPHDESIFESTHAFTAHSSTDRESD